MSNQKQIKKSFDLAYGRDNDILEYFERPEINYAAAVREGLRLLIAQNEGRETFEAKALILLEQIVNVLDSGVPLASDEDIVPPGGYDDPFLDSSL